MSIVGFSVPVSVTLYYLYIISNDKKKDVTEKIYNQFLEKVLK